MKIYNNVDMRGNRLQNTIDAYPHYDVTLEEFEEMKRNGTLDPNAFYNILDDSIQTAPDMSDYYTKAEVDALIRQIKIEWEEKA